MVESRHDIDYFWRGGKRIPLRKEDDVFTAVVRDAAELERLRTLPGVREVEKVQNRIFKARVDEPRRDEAMAAFRSREAGGICHHAYRPADGERTRYYLTTRISVKFRPDADPEAISQTLGRAGTRILKQYPGASHTYLVEVTDDAGKNPIKVANELAELDLVEYAEPNLVNRYQGAHRPADTLFERQWHLDARAGADLAADADVSAPSAWDLTRGRRDVVVAVIDDGFDLSHPDFQGDGKVVHAKDYVDGDASPFPASSRRDYHGTPCAGVVLAEENGEGTVGIAPGCAFLPVRFPLSADDDLLWEIFDYAGRRADVISCSWGPPPVFAPQSALLRDKFAELARSGGPRKKGCVILFAAGNYNAPLDDPNDAGFVWRHPEQGLVRTNGRILNGEATHPDVIAVSASTSLNRKAAYSNWGAEISVCAPSNNFHPLNRRQLVPGRGIWTTDNEAFGEDFTSGSRFTGRFGGTSSATPLAAGVAALVLSANPELGAGEVRQILQETADKIVDDQPDPVLGRRGGSYDANGHAEWFGFGKVNAAKAVERALALRRESTGVEALRVSAAAAGRLAQTGDTRTYRARLGARLGVTLLGPDGEDFDLYVKRGAPPTTRDYDAVGYSASANEKITIAAPEPGEYFIVVRSYRGSGDFDLKVELED